MKIQKELHFNAPQSEVWQLLTDPQFTIQYMYGCEVISDWKMGSPILWQGTTEDGTKIIYVKGTITEIDPGKSVSFTMLDPNMGIEDIPENYVNMTYELETTGSGTKLTLIQGDFTHVALGQKRYEESLKGWDMVLPLMKQVMD